MQIKLNIHALLFSLIIVTISFCQDTITRIDTESKGPVTEIVPEKNYSKILYILPGGSDKQGNGSKEKPWQTITFAISHLLDANFDKRYALCIA